MVLPCGVCATSGWNWTAKSRRVSSAIAATGQFSVVPRLTKPRGGCITVSPWLIHTAIRPSRSGHDALEQPLGGEEPELGGTVLASLRGHHVASEQIAHGLHAVADAEQRDARLEEPLVRQRGLVFVDARWAAREHDARVAGREHVIDRLGARQDFRVDTQLSDPAGDELGVLRTEVEDRNPVHHRTRLSVERSG